MLEKSDRPSADFPCALPMPGTGFVVGYCEDLFLLDGWSDRAIRHPGHLLYRLTSERATFRLRVRPDLGHLSILMVPPVLFLGRPYRGELFMEDVCLGEVNAKIETWILRRFDLPAIDRERIAEFTLRNETVFTPAKRIPGNHDFRPTGCFVGAILLGPGAARPGEEVDLKS